MAEVVNLRMARKRRDRAEKAKAAANARAQHGAGKAERDAHKAENARTNRQIDGMKRDRED